MGPTGEAAAGLPAAQRCCHSGHGTPNPWPMRSGGGVRNAGATGGHSSTTHRDALHRRCDDVSPANQSRPALRSPGILPLIPTLAGLRSRLRGSSAGMSEHHRATGRLVAVGAVGLAVCCVVPALAVLAGALSVGVILGPLAFGAGVTALGTIVLMRGRHHTVGHRHRLPPCSSR